MAGADRIAEFKEVAELMPDDPVVRFGLAGAYLDAGQPESAVAEYRETIRLKPDYSAAHRGLGRALERAGRASPRDSRLAWKPRLSEKACRLKAIRLRVKRLGRTIRARGLHPAQDGR